MKQFISDSLWLLRTSGSDPRRLNIGIILSALLYTWMSLGLVLDLSLNWKGKASLDGATDLIAVWQAYCRLLVLLFNRNKFVRLFCALEEFWPVDKYGEAFQGRADIAYSSMRKFLKTMKITYLIFYLSYVLKPVITRSKTLVVPFYYPGLDMHKTPAFEILYTFQLLCASSGVSLTCGFDVLFVSVIFYVVMELRIIKEGVSKITVSASNSEDDERSFCEFKTLVQHHSKVLGVIQDIDDCYSILILNQFLTSTFCVCGALLVLISESFAGQSLTYVAYLMTFLGQIFFYSAAGSIITTECERVADTLYEMQWWVKTQPKLRGGIVLAILRSQKGGKLTGGGMFDLDLNCFTTVVKTAMSFFTLVRTALSNTSS